MTSPNATYRLQFRNGMTFERAAGLVAYLKRLGVSHLYASPLFAAAQGSTHGYDAVDFTAIDPLIGGEQGFNQLSAALKEAGLGLLLDFVPNHMAAAEGNRWWQEVLEWGPDSPSAMIFDIDWSAPKLILPILGSPHGDALQDGVFGVVFDAAAGAFTFTCYDRHLPLTPPSYGKLLARTTDSAFADLARCFTTADVKQSTVLKRRLADLVTKPRHATAIAEMVVAAGKDHDFLDEIHEAQVWRLSHWHSARNALTYRRFFEIADLICLRVEDRRVFETVHARLFELIAAGHISGVRLDHIDGLADPRTYLECFQQAVGGTTQFYLLVEKILEQEERLRRDWPVAGTTGYEFIAALAGLFVDRRREDLMSRAYGGFVGEASDYAAAARAAKREILEYNLAAELAKLTAQVQALAATNGRAQFDTNALRRAIVELSAALPVYRSYVTAAGPDEADRALIAHAAREAARTGISNNSEAIDFVARLLLLDVDRPADRDAALAFAIRFQQTTGPVMAKAVEDTMFYRYNRLIALNEVGGTPDRYGAPVSTFHVAMAERQAAHPGGLSATATHDTKRGEDARARLYILSEMPEVWQEAVRRWAEMNARHRTTLADGPAPEPALEWLFYQSLVGAWPFGLFSNNSSQEDSAALAALRARMLAYMEKAAREAKTRTSWIDQNTAYETAVGAFVSGALSAETGSEFLLDFVRTCKPVWLAGAVNGLAQLAVKLAAPGVPDFYQGAELWDFGLVDPDNRAAVNFAARQDFLDGCSHLEPTTLIKDWKGGAPKMALTAVGLRARAERPALFAEGKYAALTATGKRARHVVAFARRLDGAFVIVVAPRLVLELTEGIDGLLIPVERWGDTAVILPAPLRGRPMHDIMTGTAHEGGDALRLATVFAQFPVALLVDAGH